MKKNNYKIVVLSDLKKTTQATLKSAVSLAHMLDGTIDFFHVKKPTELVEQDNQLSAMRTINHRFTKIDDKIQNVTSSLSKEYGIAINYSFTFGNAKDEIEKFLIETKPDIVVLGKRRAKIINLNGDSMTKFVLKKFNGIIMIASDTNVLEPHQDVTLGVLNSYETADSLSFAHDLLAYTKKPLQSFRIVDSSTKFTEMDSTGNNKAIDYVFEQRDNAIENLSKYLSRSKINLLCIDRDGSSKKGSNIVQSDIKKVIDNLNVSIMFGGEKFTKNESKIVKKLK